MFFISTVAGWCASLDSSESPLEGQGSGSAWRVIAEREGEAAALVPVVSAMGREREINGVSQVPEATHIKRDRLPT